MTDTDPAVLLLTQAADIVGGARRKAYGTPEDNFRRIAARWNVTLRLRFPTAAIELTPTDVAILMADMKLARLVETPDHADSWRDLAGYAACGARCSGADVAGGRP